MLDIGWSELLVIAVVAIIFVGPRDLIPMLRTFGQYAAKLKKMAGEFQSQFNEALREAELDDIQKTVSDVRKMTPLNAIKDQFESEMGEIGKLAESVKPGGGGVKAENSGAADKAAPTSGGAASGTARKPSGAKKTSGGKTPGKKPTAAKAPARKPSTGKVGGGTGSKKNGAGTGKTGAADGKA